MRSSKHLRSLATGRPDPLTALSPAEAARLGKKMTRRVLDLFVTWSDEIATIDGDLRDPWEDFLRHLKGRPPMQPTALIKATAVNGTDYALIDTYRPVRDVSRGSLKVNSLPSASALDEEIDLDLLTSNRWKGLRLLDTLRKAATVARRERSWGVCVICAGEPTQEEQISAGHVRERLLELRDQSCNLFLACAVPLEQVTNVQHAVQQLELSEQEFALFPYTSGGVYSAVASCFTAAGSVVARKWPE